MRLVEEVFKTLKEAVGLTDVSGWSDQDIKRAGHIDDAEITDDPYDYRNRRATFSVYIGKRMVKGGLLGPAAAKYAGAIKKNRPDANVLVIMDM